MRRRAPAQHSFHHGFFGEFEAVRHAVDAKEGVKGRFGISQANPAHGTEPLHHKMAPQSVFFHGFPDEGLTLSEGGDGGVLHERGGA